MGERGQITIEALIIVGIFIIILVGISLPLMFHAKRTATDVTVIADARYATEQIAAAANSVVTPGTKRTVDVYVPGYNSTARVITTTITTDGSNLTTTVTIPDEDPYNMTIELYGDNWEMEDINESVGNRYSFIITWKNITWSIS
jgi:uncharacterized protein (UPF0333 family)